MAEEQHEFGFRGVWVPADILVKLVEGVIKAADVPLLLVIDALVKDGVGCYASNEYLAKHTGRGLSQTREAISRLKGMGLLRQVSFDGKRRYLETAWSRVVVEGVGCRETGRQSAGKPAPDIVLLRNTKYVPDAIGDGAGGEGFGIAKTKPKKAAQTDTDAANQLLAAIRKRLPGHPNVKRARPSVWADHIAKLRSLDEIPAPRIQKVLDWYTRHMGEDFVPQAYSGESFRKKFLAIETAMGRDATGTVTITPEAERVAGRLAMLGWPKGSTEAVPGAVQVCLERYGAWVAALNAATAKLGGGQLPSIHRLAQHVGRVLPAPTQFVQEWMTAVHERVAGWDGWSGDFTPYLFKPDAKRFRNMGRGWADSYNNDPDTWDRLMDVITEGTE